MMSRVVLVELTAKPGQEQVAHDLIVENAQASLDHEQGCLRFDVSIDPANPARFILYEIYRQASDFEDHLAMPHYLSFDAIAQEVFAEKTVHLLDLVPNHR